MEERDKGEVKGESKGNKEDGGGRRIMIRCAHGATPHSERTVRATFRIGIRRRGFRPAHS